MSIQADAAARLMSPAQMSLLLAAERLVAQYGVRGFTIRMLNAEAGARNASAVHYHFGSRDGLIRAVWEYRMATINPRRLQMLANVAPGDVERIVEAIIRPLAEQLEPRPEGNFYVRFLERLVREADYAAYGVRLDWAEGWLRAYAMLREALAGLPPEMIDVKLRFVRTLITSGMAGMEADLERGGLSAELLPTMLEALKDGVMALMSGRSSLVAAPRTGAKASGRPAAPTGSSSSGSAGG